MGRLFEELETAEFAPDLLGGLEDSTYGRAVCYFAGLKPQERELLHWQMPQRKNLERIYPYVLFMLAGYAQRDPSRHSVAAKGMVHREIDTMEQIVDLAQQADDFFPFVKDYEITLTDSDTGETYPYTVRAWDDERPQADAGFLPRLNRLAEHLRHAHEFVEDPDYAYFGTQEQMIFDLARVIK